MNEIIILSLILLSIFSIFLLYRLYEKKGLLYSYVLLNILSFVLTFKITTFLKTNINIGIVPLLSSFIPIYIYMIKYGTKDIKDFYKLSIYSNILVATLLIIMNYFIPTLTETISINIKGTFEYNYKILIIYPIIILLSQYIIIKIYNLLDSIQTNIFLSLILIYILSSLVYTIIFYPLCYINILSLKTSIFLGIATYIFGLISNMINVSFAYIITKKKVKK